MSIAETEVAPPLTNRKVFLGVLMMIYISSYLDRQIIAILLPHPYSKPGQYFCDDGNDSVTSLAARKNLLGRRVQGCNFFRRLTNCIVPELLVVLATTVATHCRNMRLDLDNLEIAIPRQRLFNRTEQPLPEANARIREARCKISPLVQRVHDDLLAIAE